MMKNKLIIITILVAILAGAGGFFAGVKYQQSRRATFPFGQTNNRNGQIRGVNNNNGFRPVSGEIISSDDKSITVKLNDGSSKIVLINDQTQINKAASATKEDLKNGENVMIVGTNNSDGSVTAENIQLNPQNLRVNQGQSQ